MKTSFLNWVVAGLITVTSGIAIVDKDYRDEYFNLAQTSLPALLKVLGSTKTSEKSKNRSQKDDQE